MEGIRHAQLFAINSVPKVVHEALQPRIRGHICSMRDNWLTLYFRMPRGSCTELSVERGTADTRAR